MFVDKKIEVGKVEKNIKKLGGEILKEIELFDVFENQESNKKSLAFHLKFGKDDQTLKGEEVDSKIEEIMKELEKEGYEVRNS